MEELQALRKKLEVEAALDKVRAKALAMQSSSRPLNADDTERSGKSPQIRIQDNGPGVP